MERHNRTRDAGNALAQELEHNHPTQPDEPDSGFAERIDLEPDELKPDFARGIREGPEADVEVQRRFSEGAEQTPETPDKTIKRRFSEGVEQTPETPDKTTERRFSEGVERSPTSA
jgi:hypothetical protein